MLRCAPLDAVARHGFTSRQLGLRPGDAAPLAWASAAASVGCEVSHAGARAAGARRRRARRARGGRPAPPPEADAAVTNAPGVAVAVVAADCVPVLLADPRTGAVAAVHAGWRGTAANAVGAAVAAHDPRVRRRAPTRSWPPSARASARAATRWARSCSSAFAAAGHASGDLAAWFARDAAGRLRLDLWRANADLLVRAGVPAGQVHVAGLCTKTHVDVLESFRVDGVARRPHGRDHRGAVARPGPGTAAGRQDG